MIHSVYSIVGRDDRLFDRYRTSFSAALSSDYLRRGFVIVPEKDKGKSYIVVNHDVSSTHSPGCPFYTLKPLVRRMDESDFTKMNRSFVFGSEKSYETWEEWEGIKCSIMRMDTGTY